MNFKMIAAAAALVAAGTANASVDTLASGNSSVGFLSYNTTTQTSVFVDLGVNLNDFVPATYTVTDDFGNPKVGAIAQGALASDGVTAVWNFSTGVYTLNGVAQNIGSTNWSAYGSFLSTVSTQKWAVVGGDSTANSALDNAQHLLTTGNPSSSQLEAQGASATANMVNVDNFYTRLNGKTSISGVDNGSYFATAKTDLGSVLKSDNFGTNWRTNLAWASTTEATAAAPSTNSFWFMVGDGGEFQVTGTWTLDVTKQTLTWSTPAAAVPEASSYAMLLSGLATIGLLRRRKAK